MAKESGSAGATGGVSAVGVVQIIFIIMKLCAPETAIYHWPWWKVMLPLECSVGLVILIGCCGGCCACWCTICEKKDKSVATPGVDLTREQIRSIQYTQTRTVRTQQPATKPVVATQVPVVAPAVPKEESKEASEFHSIAKEDSKIIGEENV